MKIGVDFYRIGDEIFCHWTFVGYSESFAGKGSSQKEAFLNLIRKYPFIGIELSHQQTQWENEHNKPNNKVVL